MKTEIIFIGGWVSGKFMDFVVGNKYSLLGNSIYDGDKALGEINAQEMANHFKISK